MIRKHAKPERVALMRDRLNSADLALCEAARAGALTEKGDLWLRDVLHVLRRFIDDVERHAGETRAP